MAEVSSWFECLSDEDIIDIVTNKKWDPNCALIEGDHSETIDTITRFKGKDGSQSIFIKAHDHNVNIFVILTEFGVFKFTNHYLDPNRFESCRRITHQHNVELVDKILYEQNPGQNEYNPSNYDYSLVLQKILAKRNEGNTKDGRTYYEDLCLHMNEFAEFMYRENVKICKARLDAAKQTIKRVAYQHDCDMSKIKPSQGVQP